MAGVSKREARWTATVRASQLVLLDEEAEAAGISRQEMHSAILTWGLAELRAKRTSGAKSEAKPSDTLSGTNSEAKLSKQKGPAALAARPAAKRFVTDGKGNVYAAPSGPQEAVAAAKPAPAASETKAAPEATPGAGIDPFGDLPHTSPTFVNPLGDRMPSNANEAASMISAFFAHKHATKTKRELKAEQEALAELPPAVRDCIVANTSEPKTSEPTESNNPFDALN